MSLPQSFTILPLQAPSLLKETNMQAKFCENEEAGKVNHTARVFSNLTTQLKRRGGNPREDSSAELRCQKKEEIKTNHLGEGNGNPLQYSCLENPMDRGA